MEHMKKHMLINNAFQGKEKLMAMINRDNNPELIQAIQLTAIKIGEKGFRKDKSQEKSLETDSSLPYELRTDATDAYDTNIIGCITMPYDDNSFRFAWVLFSACNVATLQKKLTFFLQNPKKPYICSGKILERHEKQPHHSGIFYARTSCNIKVIIGFEGLGSSNARRFALITLTPLSEPFCLTSKY